jgi:hypothetical protein
LEKTDFGRTPFQAQEIRTMKKATTTAAAARAATALLT